MKEEKVYSVTMTEEELRLFSEFLEQKNFYSVQALPPRKPFVGRSKMPKLKSVKPATAKSTVMIKN